MDEGDAVIASVQVPVGDREQVTDLAVRVVDDGVERRDATEVVGVVVLQGEVVLSAVVLDEQLHRPDPFWSVTQDGRRDRRPPQRPSHFIRCDLAVAERALGEVP